MYMFPFGGKNHTTEMIFNRVFILLKVLYFTGCLNTLEIHLLAKIYKH